MTTKQQVSEEQRRRALRHWLVFGLLAEARLRAATRPRPCCDATAHKRLEGTAGDAILENLIG